MSLDEQRLIARMAPSLQRVLVVDPAQANARMLGDVMRTLFRSQIWTAATPARAAELVRTADPQLVFTELAAPPVDGVEFTRFLRRSDAACRQAPVIMIAANATAAGILAARDAGVHEFLRRPFTTKDLLRRLDAVVLRPRDWIEAVSYIGPDRRRFNSGDYTGPLKRRADATATPDEARIAQALRIVKSAAQALDTDYPQAVRALHAQAQALFKAAQSTGNAALAQGAVKLQKSLTPSLNGGPDKTVIVACCAELAAFMPAGQDKGRAAA